MKVSASVDSSAQRLLDDMLADLAGSGIPPEAAKRMQVTPVRTPKGVGYRIPYLDQHGKDTGYSRIKFTDTGRGFKALTVKSKKYDQTSDTIPQVYIPPLFSDWPTYLQSDQRLLITEGEKKSAKATLEGFPCIGLGGVECFQSRRANITLLPFFDEINLKREIFIIYDSDGTINKSVNRAAVKLGALLRRRGATVFIIFLPAANDGSKIGLDDYLL